MRIDLPSCPLKSCRYQNDGNCTDTKNYKDCILRDMIQIPQNATNGDVIKAMFPQIEVEHNNSGIHDLMNVYNLDSNKVQFPTPLFTDWWDAPYKSESEDK